MRKYENLKFIHENTLPPRAYYIPYGSLEKALEGKRENSDRFMLLNGIWDFKYHSRDIDCPDVIEEWGSIDVPSNWQTRGIEKPYYTNVNYPYPVDPPYVPDDNPVGVYRRKIEIDEKTSKLENYLIFEGVAPCLEVYINGEYAGFSTVSHCISEFKVKLKKGTNEILVKVYKWCMGSYLEDQDFFRHNGIFRDVYILSRPKNHLFDIAIGFDDKNIYYEGNYKVYDADMNETNLENPILWNAEKPYLYTVIVEDNGEFIPFKIGLRRQEISKKGELLINGVSVKLKGVNRHDTHPENGYVMTYEEMKDELLKMKELNINCIRTSHYPPQPLFMELCDELGFYVIDEADIETHGFATRRSNKKTYDLDPLWPCQNPEWKEAFLDRGERLFQRDKNHTCVIMWSLGNEANYGENFDAMSAMIKEKDKAIPGVVRLIHYENAYNHVSKIPSAVSPDHEAVDIMSRMYRTPGQMIDYIESTNDPRPVFYCEYSHQKGPGSGEMHHHWRAIEKYPSFIGGCIWEWADHVALDEQGRKCYGGDFGEETHDTDGCCDGLVFSDRSFNAGSYEAKYAYQPLKTEYEDGILYITNKYDFTCLSECNIVWDITADGKVIKSGGFELSLPPHKTQEIPFETEIPECKYGAYLNIRMYNKSYEVAATQHELKGADKIPTGEEKARIEYIGEYAVVKGKDFEYKFNMHYGRLEMLDDFLASPMEFFIWKAAMGQDQNTIESWISENYNRPLHNKVYDKWIFDNTLTVVGSLSNISRMPFFRYTLKLTFFNDGRIDVQLDGEFDNERTYLPGLGFEFKTKETDFEYFGYGPQESYCDMCCGSKMGMYKSNAEKEYVPYIMPQEHGNHYNTKYFKLGKFKFTSQQGFEIKVSEYTTQELDKKKHYFELEKDEYTNVRIAYKISGRDAGGNNPFTQRDRLYEKNIHFEFTIERD